MTRLHTLAEADLHDKRVLLRAGFDLPMENGVVTDISRIEAMIPTMKAILDGGGSLVIMAHQGRPKGKVVPEESQRPLVSILEKLLKTNVHLQENFSDVPQAPVTLLENLRFDAREEKDDGSFAKELAALGDVYVNDAFTNCHRKHASMVGVPALLPSYMGLQLQQEVEHLQMITQNPVRPLCMIVCGAKMETKVPVIEAFLERGDDVLLGGAIANTFLVAQGKNVGTSLFEQEQVEVAKRILEKCARSGSARVHLPMDAVVALSLDRPNDAQTVLCDALSPDQAIFDIGPQSVEEYWSVIGRSKTIVWNGPLGCYETEAFSQATRAIAAALAEATKHGARTIIGGGDTLDAHVRYDLPLDAYTFASTGGGAMLEFIADGTLPAIEALKRD